MNETETVNVGDGAENGCSFPISSGSADHARWFTFTPAQNGEYTIGSSGFTIADTRLSIYTGNCGSLSCFASNDDINGLANQAAMAIATVMITLLLQAKRSVETALSPLRLRVFPVAVLLVLPFAKAQLPVQSRQ